MNGPQLPFSAAWGGATPASFDAQSWGMYPRGVEAFPWRYFVLAAALPKAVVWLLVPSQ